MSENTKHSVGKTSLSEEHKTAKVTHKKVEHPLAVKAVHEFKLPLSGGAVNNFPKGYIVTDPILIRDMIEGGCPVVPVEQDVDFHICSKCHHQDPIAPVLRDEILAARSKLLVQN